MQTMNEMIFQTSVSWAAV